MGKTTQSRRSLHSLFGTLLGCAMMLGANFPVAADDTDIYLLPSVVNINTNPKVLFILGNSASMDHEEIAVAFQDFDPAGTYTGSFDESKLYWCLHEDTNCTNTEPGGDLPVPATTTQFFDDDPSVNACTTATGVASNGWADTDALGWHAVETGGYKWSTLNADNTHLRIECLDDEVQNGNIESNSAKYVQAGTQTGSTAYYTNNQNRKITEAERTRFISGKFLNYLENPPALGGFKTRIQMAKDALTAMINTTTNVDMGLMVFNRNWTGDHNDPNADGTAHGGRVILPIRSTQVATVHKTNALAAINGSGTYPALTGATSDPQPQDVGVSGHPTDPVFNLVDHGSNPIVPPDLSADPHMNYPAPLSETYWEALNYLLGNEVQYGDDDTVTSLGTVLTVDGALNESLVLIDYGSSAPLRDLAAEAAPKELEAIPKYISPFDRQCQQVFIVYITDGVYKYPNAAGSSISGDGDADNDFSGWPSILAGWNDEVDTPETSVAGNTLDDMAYVAFNNDVMDNDTLDGIQRVVTHVVGVDVDEGSAEETLLKKTARNGSGTYTTADSASAVADALANVVTDIKAEVRSYVAPTLSVNAFNKLFNRDEVYFALFTPTTEHIRWAGNIKKFTLCNEDQAEAGHCEFGEVVYCDTDQIPCDAPDSAIDDFLRIAPGARSYWSTGTDGNSVTDGGAGEVLQSLISAGTRKVYAIPSTDYSNMSFPVNLSSYPVSPTSGPLYDAAIVTPSIVGAGSATEAKQVLAWMYGFDTEDEDEDGTSWVEGKTVTEARWPIASPLHSRPAAITFGAPFCTASEIADEDSDCHQQTTSNRNGDKAVIKLFVGTNDGVVRMINDHNGKEEWAIVISDLLADQKELMVNSSGDKFYGMDATPTFWVRDVDGDGVIECGDCDGVIEIDNNEDFVMMFIGMRRGGKNIYAFDVTPTSTLTNRNSVTGITPRLVWVIHGASSASRATSASPYYRMEQTWSAPQIMETTFCKPTGADDCSAGNTQEKTLLAFGGGYSPNQDTTVNTETGTGTDAPYGNAIYLVDPDPAQIDNNGEPRRVLMIGGPEPDENTDTDNDPEVVHSQMVYSIPMDLTVFDSDRDGRDDRILFGDVAGQVWRVDVGDDLFYGVRKRTVAAIFADLSCADPDSGTNGRPDCFDADFNNSIDYPNEVKTGVQHRRKFLHQLDIALVRDTNFSDVEGGAVSDYDVISIVSGDRADPTDDFTEGAVTAVEAVNNRIYALREYQIDPIPLDADGDAIDGTYPWCVTPDGTNNILSACTQGVIVEADLTDLTEADLALTNTQLTDLKGSTGWFVSLKEDTLFDIKPDGVNVAFQSKWRGEKGLAPPVIFDNIIFVTTYVPADEETAVQTCSPDEGAGHLYALNLLNGVAELDLDTTTADFDRSVFVGGGIPSELVVVIREGGTTGLVGISGGTATPNIGDSIPRGKTFWLQK